MSDLNFEKLYTKNKNHQRYPTEFVIRILNGGRYPNLKLSRKVQPGDKILDLGFGDGRNIGLLHDLGLNVSGIEVTETIVNDVTQYWRAKGVDANLKLGRNSSIPFPDRYFDIVLASGSCYYIDKNQTFLDNLREISRVLKPGGLLIANLPTKGNFIVEAGEILPDEYVLINKDPYGLRNGQLLKYFSSPKSLELSFSEFMDNFSFGVLEDDFFGVQINSILVTCTKRST